MKKKNGFTLVEILAVVVILAILSLIAIPVVSKIIQESKEKLYREQVDRILEAAEKYMQDNDQKLPKKMVDNFDVSQAPVSFVTITELHDSSFIKESDPKNPIKSGDSMDPYVALYYNTPKNQYEAVYCVSEKYYKYYYSKEEYTTKVVVVCKDKISNNWQELTSTTTTTKPLVCNEPLVYNLSATAVGTSKVNLLFETVNSTKVEVVYNEQGSSTTHTENSTCSMGGCSITGLKANTTYEFVVKAINECASETKRVDSDPISATTGSVTAPVFMSVSPSDGSEFVLINSKSWSKSDVDVKIKYYDDGFINPQHYFRVESHESPTQDNITANKIVYYCGESTDVCIETPIASGQRLTTGWYKVVEDEVILKYDREYDYIFNAITKDAENTETASLTTSAIDKTGPTISNIGLTPSANSIGVSFNVSDTLTDKNAEGVGVDSSTGIVCKAGTNSNNLSISGTYTSGKCNFSGLSSNTTYYVQISVTDRVGNTTQSEISTTKTDANECVVTYYDGDKNKYTTKISCGNYFSEVVTKDTYAIDNMLGTWVFDGWSNNSSTYSTEKNYLVTSNVTLYPSFHNYKDASVRHYVNTRTVNPSNFCSNSGTYYYIDSFACSDARVSNVYINNTRYSGPISQGTTIAFYETIPQTGDNGSSVVQGGCMRTDPSTSLSMASGHSSQISVRDPQGHYYNSLTRENNAGTPYYTCGEKKDTYCYVHGKSDAYKC